MQLDLELVSKIMTVSIVIVTVIVVVLVTDIGYIFIKAAVNQTKLINKCDRLRSQKDQLLRRSVWKNNKVPHIN